MYGDLAEKLISDARRAGNLEALPLYQTELVRAISRETRELALLEDQALETAGESRVEQVFPGVYGLCQRRNKRCLLAYHFHRAKRLEQLVWNEQDGQDLGVLSTAEQSYLRNFNDLVTKFKENWEEIDLTGSMEPPKDMYVEARCLKDAGEIQTEYGVFDLTKNSQFYVRKSDVQRLIQQGLVELVKKGN